MSLNGKIFIGDITFVEVGQDDYHTLRKTYSMVTDRHFCIVHKVTDILPLTEENLDKIENEGLSYLVPSEYTGCTYWEEGCF